MSNAASTQFGHVQSFRQQRGFGCICADDGKSFFFHKSAVEAPDDQTAEQVLMHLRPNSRVSFRSVKNSKSNKGKQHKKKKKNPKATCVCHLVTVRVAKPMAELCSNDDTPTFEMVEKDTAWCIQNGYQETKAGCWEISIASDEKEDDEADNGPSGNSDFSESILDEPLQSSSRRDSDSMSAVEECGWTIQHFEAARRDEGPGEGWDEHDFKMASMTLHDWVEAGFPIHEFKKFKWMWGLRMRVRTA